MKHTDNYYNNKVRKLMQPILDTIEKAYPWCTIYPFIVSWLRSNPYEKWVNFDLCWKNSNGVHFTWEFIHTTSYEKLYEIIKAMDTKELNDKVLNLFKEKCLKIQ